MSAKDSGGEEKLSNWSSALTDGVLLASGNDSGSVFVFQGSVVKSTTPPPIEWRIAPSLQGPRTFVVTLLVL